MDMTQMTNTPSADSVAKPPEMKKSFWQNFSTWPRRISRRGQWIVVIAAAFVVVGLIFQCGMYIGTQRALLAVHWQQGYVQSISGDVNTPGMFDDDQQMMRSFGGSNGVVGQIVYINGSIWTVRDLNSLEKVVRILPQTIIMNNNSRVLPSNVHVDDPVVVLGAPNSRAQLEARLVRILPFIPYIKK